MSKLITSSIIALNYWEKFLVYYDKNWDCWFFPWLPTIDYWEDDMSHVKDYLSGLNVGYDSLWIASFGDQYSSVKWSTEHNEYRSYSYRLYRGVITNLPDGLSESEEFMVRGMKCRLMTIQEMLDDDRVSTVNRDVVDMVKNNISFN